MGMRLISDKLLGRGRGFLADTSGNFVIVTALTMPLAIILAAIAVDVGSLYTERRAAQAITDLAAITAAANLKQPRAAIAATLADNDLRNVAIDDDTQAQQTHRPDEAVMSVVRGHYSGDPREAPTSRFKAGSAPTNSVKVYYRKLGGLFFGKSLISEPTITTEAVARSSSEAAFSVGSRLLRLEDGILNAILGGLLGTRLSLRAMDYEALASADVDAFKFMDALATKLNITAGTYNDVLDSDASVGQVASAIAAIPGMDDEAKVAAQALGLSAARTLPLKQLIGVGDFGQLGIGEHAAGLDASVTALEMLTAAAAVANGDHQVEVNLGTSIPGILGAKLQLAVGEPAQQSPWFSIGDKGKVVRTAQTRTLLTTSIGGPGGLLGASIELPIYVEVAYAEAKLNDISCTGNKVDSVKVDARPGVVTAQIGALNGSSLDDFDRPLTLGPATIVKAPLVTVTGQASAEMANPDFKTLKYEPEDIAAHSIQTVATTNFTQSLTSSLLNNLDLNVSVAGLGIGTGNIASTLASALQPVTPAVDSLLNSVLEAVGIRLGEADVRVVGAVCNRSVLVQ
ncbi:MAG: pilus assembly protein TadG-related protein [Rhizobiaceae bacterium]